MIDTHTHLYLSEFCADGDSPGAAVDRAVEAGVTTLVMPNVDITTIGPMKKLADERPEAVRLAMGLHPTELGDDWRAAVDRIETELRAPGRYKYVAVGEVGIDLYWDDTQRDEQMLAFDRQAQLAAELQLPLIIHCRDGLDETLEVLEGLPKAPPAIVMHCFGGSAADVDTIRRRASAVPEIYFGIGGVVTFKKSTLPDTLPAIGLDHIVLETDSPYLAPVPKRGRRNESAYLTYTASAIAGKMGISVDNVDSITTANARRLFPRL